MPFSLIMDKSSDAFIRCFTNIDLQNFSMNLRIFVDNLRTFIDNLETFTDDLRTFRRIDIT